MKKTILITFLCVTLMLVTPFTTVAQENTVSNNLPEQPDDVEGLVAQIRNAINQMLEKYEHNQIVRIFFNLILNTLGLFGQILLCIFLTTLVILFYAFTLFLIRVRLDETNLGKLFEFYTFLLVMVWGDECLGPLPFPSIYDLEGMVKESNLDCRCSLIR